MPMPHIQSCIMSLIPPRTIVRDFNEVCPLDRPIGFVATKDLLPILCEEDHVVDYGYTALHAGRANRHAGNGETYGLRLFNE